MIDIKARLRAGQPCIGAWLSVPSVKVADAMASCGFHWMAVDLEHGTVSLETTEACFVAAERHGVAPFARLTSADPYAGRRLLDAGAAGLIVPVVEDAAAFRAFAHHCAYPPHGRRGVGLSRCNGYGDRFQEYLAGFSPVLVPQIETLKGVEAAADIAALDCVDAVFIGPYDLSADLGVPGDFTAPVFVAALERLRQACARHHKPLGIHQVAPVAAELSARIAEGYLFIAYATDVIALRTALGNPARLAEGVEP